MPTPSILALDVGEKRVGIAIAGAVARLPRPLTTLEYNASFWTDLGIIIKDETVERLVVGYPRNQGGEATAQTAAVEAFAARLQSETGLPVMFQDESLTSKKAEAELEKRGRAYGKGDIDSLAATYILEDYFINKPPTGTV